MEFHLLGLIGAESDSGPIKLGGQKEQALLAALLVGAGSVQSTDRLVHAIWGEEVPETAEKTLRSHLSRLRSRLKVSGDPIKTVSGGYLLDPEEHGIDSVLFEKLLHDARAQRDRGSHSGAVTKLSEALKLWRGPPLFGLDDYPFARLEATRLEGLRLEAVEARVDSELELGHHQRLVVEVERLVESYPLREGLWRALMIALYRSGRQADALRAYQRARSILGEELGIDPSPELQDLEQAILTHSETIHTAGGTDRFEILPATRTSFIGREDEIVNLRALLSESRWVTVTGTGGGGKTRLTSEAVRGAISNYEHGVVFVGLASVFEPGHIPEHIASVLGDVGSHAIDVTSALVEFLEPRNLLLVLDNCEHVVRAVAPIIDALLAGAPRLSVVATSREPIGAIDEVVFQISPLKTPDLDVGPGQQEESESVRLFVERVRAFDRSFAISDANRESVVSICRTLDGIPLAIELAAARVRAMVPAEIAARMDDRFSLLDSGSHMSPPRHQTLRAAIDWSYQLCPEDARSALRRLSVFAGGWDLDAAEAVLADRSISKAQVAGLIADLVDRNLVERDVARERSRYRLLETIRQFAFDALVVSGEASSVTDRHRDWFVELAEKAEPFLKGPRQLEWLERLDSDHDNMRAAIGSSLADRNPSAGFRLVGALGWYWFMRGHWHEAWRWVGRCIEHQGEIDPLLWAKVVYTTGSIEVIRGKNDPMTELLEQALENCRRGEDRLGEAWALHYQGHAVGWVGNQDAVDLMRQGLEIFLELDESWAVAWSWRYIGQALSFDEGIEFQKKALDRFAYLGDRWSIAYSLYLIGVAYLGALNFEDAVEALEESIAIASEMGDVIWKAHSTGRLGAATFYLGDKKRAKRLLDEGIDLHRRIGDDNCTGVLLGYQGLVAANEHRWDEAVTATSESLRIWEKLGNRIAFAGHLSRLAAALAGRGEVHQAAILFGATLAPDVPTQYLETPLVIAEREELQRHLRSVLGADYEDLITAGKEMGIDEAAKMGMSHA